MVELTDSTYNKLDELQDITGKWKKQIISEMIDAELARELLIKTKAMKADQQRAGNVPV